MGILLTLPDELLLVARSTRPSLCAIRQEADSRVIRTPLAFEEVEDRRGKK